MPRSSEDVASRIQYRVDDYSVIALTDIYIMHTTIEKERKQNRKEITI